MNHTLFLGYHLAKNIRGIDDSLVNAPSWYREYPIIYKVLAPSQVVVWDFWTINSMIQDMNQPG